MKRLVQSAMCAAVLLLGSQAFAEEMSKDGMKMSKDEMMKQCMKEQTEMNASMSKADMKKACDEKMMKMDKDKMQKGKDNMSK